MAIVVKKFIIALVLSLTMGVFLIPSKVNAETWGIWRNLDWEFYNYYSDIYGMRATVEIPEDIGRLQITIPDYGNLLTYTEDAGATNTNMCFDAPSGCINFYDLYATTPPAFPSGTFDIWLNELNGVDYSNSTTIYFNIMVDFDVLPSGFYTEWQDDFTL